MHSLRSVLVLVFAGLCIFFLSGCTANTSTPTGSESLITSAEVAVHDSIDSCWMIIDGNVYDVTEYIPDHPAGVNSILAGCGKDASDMFSSVGHSPTAREILGSYLLGAVAD